MHGTYIKIYFIFDNFSPPKTVPFSRNVVKLNSRATDDNIIRPRKDVICMPGI